MPGAPSRRIWRVPFCFVADWMGFETTNQVLEEAKQMVLDVRSLRFVSTIIKQTNLYLMGLTSVSEKKLTPELGIFLSLVSSPFLRCLIS
jgi:hypothetical protein